MKNFDFTKIKWAGEICILITDRMTREAIIFTKHEIENLNKVLALENHSRTEFESIDSEKGFGSPSSKSDGATNHSPQSKPVLPNSDKSLRVAELKEGVSNLCKNCGFDEDKHRKKDLRCQSYDMSYGETILLKTKFTPQNPQDKK